MLCRFICRYPLGNRRGQGGSSAAFLSPVPQGHVVYGSGATARVVSQASQLAGLPRRRLTVSLYLWVPLCRANGVEDTQTGMPLSESRDPQ